MPSPYNAAPPLSQALPTIEGVTVSFSSGSSMCDTTEISTLITFVNNHGDVPGITLQNNLASSGGTVTLSTETGAFSGVLCRVGGPGGPGARKER